MMERLGALNETEDYLDYIPKDTESNYAPFCTSKVCTKETKGMPAQKRKTKMRDFCPDCNGRLSFFKRQAYVVKIGRGRLK